MRTYRRFGEEEKKVALQYYVRLGPLGASHMFLHPAFLGVRHLAKIFFVFLPKPSHPPTCSGRQKSVYAVVDLNQPTYQLNADNQPTYQHTAHAKASPSLLDTLPGADGRAQLNMCSTGA